MLHIAFLVTFCDLLLQMAQATTMPCNKYEVLWSCESLATPVAGTIPPRYVMPPPESPVIDPATGTQCIFLPPTEPPKVDCHMIAKENNMVKVQLNGATKLTGNVIGSELTKTAPCNVASSVSMDIPLVVTPEGGVQCGNMPPLNQVQVTCTSKPSLGLLGGLLQAILNLLGSLLNLLDNLLKDTITSLLPNILIGVQDILNNIFAKLTGTIPVDETINCKRTVTDMKTDANNYIRLTCESKRVSATNGSLFTPPTDTYETPELQPKPDSACMMAVPQGLVNYAFRLGSDAKVPYEVTSATVLATLSVTVSSICGKPLAISRLVFKPTESPQLTITTGRISATQRGSFCVYVAGSTTPLLTATADVMFTGQITVKAGCITATLMYETMINVRLIPGPNTCDVAYQASLTFTAELKGKALTEKCVEPSPAEALPMTGPTTCTPKDGYMEIETKRY